MSRTIKDTPYWVVSRKASEHGFVTPVHVISEPYHRLYRQDLLSIVVPMGSQDMIDEWCDWLADQGFSFSVSRHVENVDSMLGVPCLREHSVDSDGLAVLDAMDYADRPERRSLDPMFSVRNDKYCDVIEACRRWVYAFRFNGNHDCHDWDWDSDQDVDDYAYIDYRNRRDRHYNYGLVSRDRRDCGDSVMAERSTVRVSLREAAKAINDGMDPVDWDDEGTYRSHPGWSTWW